MLRLFLSLLICLIGSSVASQDVKYTLKNIEINNEYPHFGLMPANNNQILFTSYLLNKKGKVKVAFSGEGILQLYIGKLSGDGEITNVKPLQIDPKVSFESITSAALSTDGQQLFITTRYTNKNKPKGDFNKDNFHIEVGEYKSGIGYTNFKVLPFCKPRFSYAHPALSKDGEILYFTANFRGGRQSTKGASDIFKVDIMGNNTYGGLKNLGSKVNSYSREMFPIMHNNTLYFSSNRRNGIGGYDIYKSEMNSDGVFSKAEKLPKPLNSVKDDFSFVMLPDGKSGLLVSKRSGGNGDDDIYYFTE